MSQNDIASVYHKTYLGYLQQLKQMRFDGKDAILGITLDDDAIVVPYFGQSLRLTAEGLEDEAGRQPDFADCVVVCRYLIMCPPFEPRQKAWVAYRDFPDSGPLTVFWADTVEGLLAKTFSGKAEALKKACHAWGGRRTDMDIACDLCRCFVPLPQMPLLLIFNDADDDFPASASLLFEKRASTYLDAESLAILGHGLTKRLLTTAR